MSARTILAALRGFASEYSEMMELGRTGRLPAKRRRAGALPSDVDAPERRR